MFLNNLFLYVTYFFGENREPKSYPIELDLSDWNEKIKEFKTNRKSEKGNEKGVVGFIIHGINNDKKIKRPIRKDIKLNPHQGVKIINKIKSIVEYVIFKIILFILKEQFTKTAPSFINLLVLSRIFVN